MSDRSDFTAKPEREHGQPMITCGLSHNLPYITPQQSACLRGEHVHSGRDAGGYWIHPDRVDPELHYLGDPVCIHCRVKFVPREA